MADYVEKEDHEAGDDDNEPVPVSFTVIEIIDLTLS